MGSLGLVLEWARRGAAAVLRFTKMHGAGNDYVYVDGRGESREWHSLAVAMSDRHRGVGSDGLIVALPSENSDLRMAIFNADGSEGEMCGNGIRCLVAFALYRGIVPTGSSPVVVETLAGSRTVTPIWENGRVSSATVGMGQPVLEADEVPVLAPRLDRVLEYPLEVDGQSFVIGCVSMGNPHAVAFIDTPVDEVPLHEIGPMVEHHPMFPKRVNFEIVNVQDLRARQGARMGARLRPDGGVRHRRMRDRRGGADQRPYWERPGGGAARRLPSSAVGWAERGRHGGPGPVRIRRGVA